jgi:hypothetical protein
MRAATPAAFPNVPIGMLILVLVVVGGGPVAAPAAVARTEPQLTGKPT